MSRPALHLFGSIHVDRVGVVTRELRDAVAEVDAVCIERPRGGWDRRDSLRSLVVAPVAFVGMSLVWLAWQPLLALLVREPAPAEFAALARVREAVDVPVHPVDEPVMAQLADAGLPVAALNWGILAAGAVLLGVPFLTTAAFLTAFGVATTALSRVAPRAWLVLAIPLVVGGLAAALALAVVTPLAMLVVVAGYAGAVLVTRRRRDADMVENAAAVAEREGYDAVCLMAGKGHLPGMVERAPDRGFDLASVHRRRFARSGVTDREPDRAAGDEAVEPAMDTTRSALPRRAVAAVLDAALAAGFAVVVGLAAGVAANLLVSETAGGVAALVAIPAAALAYYAGAETRWSRTPAKRLLGLVVVREDGSPVGGRGALLRALLLPLDLVAAPVAVALTHRHRRLGDLAAGTVVVETA